MWSPSQAAVQREARRRSIFYSNINMWPFVGVMVFLLIVFMVNVPPPHHGNVVDLPLSVYAAAQPRAVREDAMKIWVTRDGKAYFRNMRVGPEQLPDLIHQAVQEGADKKVYLGVDARARYGEAAIVVEQIGKAGIREICFLVDRANR